MKHLLKNSAWQSINSLAAVGINFLLVVAYTRVLAPGDFGSLVLSQAQVLFWALLVDLGLYNGMIATLTSAGADREGGARIDRPLLLRVLIFRLGGAALGTLVVFALANASPSVSHSPAQDLAFTPFLFGLAIQQTLTPYAIFRGRLVLCVVANLAGIFVASLAAFLAARAQSSLACVLLLQSSGGLIAAAIIFAGLRGKPFMGASAETAPADLTRRLWSHSFPFAIVFAASTIWSRLDQIVASRMLGLDEGAEYAIAVRFASIAATLAAAVSTALFPDLQRVGRDDPAKLLAYTKKICRLLLLVGLPLSFAITICLAYVAPLFFPGFFKAPELLPYFAPGIWALWLNIFLVGALFGTGRYKDAVIAHVAAVALFALGLPLFAKLFAARGVVFGYDLYCLALAGISFFFLARTKFKAA